QVGRRGPRTDRSLEETVGAMKIHEYQAKEILKKYGVPVPLSIPAFSIDEAERAAKDLISKTGGEVDVVKAQIHAGGRGNAVGLAADQTRNLAYGLGLTGDAAKSAAGFLLKLYQAFVDVDAAMAEINPLVVTTDGKVLALDCKMDFDDNALYRHRDLEALRDL